MIEANEVIHYDGRIAPLLRFRNGLVLKFLYLTAARRGEAADLLWEDIVQDGSFHVAVLRHTKSGKEQRIKLRNELHAEFEEWHKMLQTNKVAAPNVFPSLGFRTLGHKMSGKGINDIVARLGKAVGLTISAHYLRHTAITLALELGEPLQKVQSYARHASANTTIRYFHDRQLLEKNPTDSLPMI
jgi:integrase